MKFRRSGLKKHKVRAQLDMTPMIDCVFQLLIFFMLSSSFVAQTSINIEMPQAIGASLLEQKDLSITLAYGDDGPGGKGKIYFDNEEVETMQELTDRMSSELSRAQETGRELSVLIRPDAKVSTGRLVEILGITRSLGIQRYRIAALPPGQVE